MPQRSAEDRLGASSGMPPSHLGSSRPPHSSIDPAAGDWQVCVWHAPAPTPAPTLDTCMRSGLRAMCMRSGLRAKL